MNDMFSIAGKKALVTGSTQGIGLAIAKCFIRSGAQVWVHGGTSEEKCRIAARHIGADDRYICQNLEAPDCAESIHDATGDVDILVLNASLQIRRPWDEITPEEFERQISINLRSSLMLMQKYADHMKRQGWGRIITIGSVQQYRPHRDMLVYAASKDALMNMVRNVAKQLAPYGVTVNNISPGVFDTPRNKQALSDETYRQAILAQIPCGYVAEPDMICGAALLLASDAGKYICGIDLTVDGGMKL